MSEQQQRIALAQWAGWRTEKRPIYWYGSDCKCDECEVAISPNGDVVVKGYPDYLHDLNAVHELEERLTDKKVYIWRLSEVLKTDCAPAWSEECFLFAHATAAQRCEALLKTLGLWKEEP